MRRPLFLGFFIGFCQREIEGDMERGFLVFGSVILWCGIPCFVDFVGLVFQEISFAVVFVAINTCTSIYN